MSEITIPSGDRERTSREPRPGAPGDEWHAVCVARSRLLAAGLVVYPLLIALVVGVMVRYAGERPEVSVVGEDALPSIVHVGNQSFDFRKRLNDATEVKLVSRTPEEAARELDSGRALATLVIPPDFADRLGSMKESPR